MSIVLVAFEGAPKVSEEAVKKDKELDDRIEAKVKGKFDSMLLLFFSDWQLKWMKLKYIVLV